MRAASKPSGACVLLPTDFQQPARRAFSYGLNIARLLGARMEPLHVIRTPTDRSGPPPDSRYLRSLKTSALLGLARLARIAKDAGAQAVARDAPCPVLAVHGGLAGDVARHPAQVKLGRLLAATDLSPDAAEALQAVSTLASLTQAKICVVHASGHEATKQDRQRNLTALTEGLRRHGLEAEGLCIPGEPIETILTQAARWEADVIAVGTQGRRRLSRLVLGSVAEGVLRRAGCPVLVVKNAAPLVRAGDRHGKRRARR